MGFLLSLGTPAGLFLRMGSLLITLCLLFKVQISVGDFPPEEARAFFDIWVSPQQ